MADTYSTNNRLEKMEPGQYLDTWGARLNGNVIDLIDAALDGVEGFALSGPKSLTNNNGAADEARKRVLNVTGGTGGTITIPNVAKAYLVRNASSGDVVITTGSGTTATIATGLVKWVFSTGSNAVYAVSGPAFGSAAVTGGSFLASGTAGVGYAAGAGGTVTQLTDKSTAVTLNKLCGAITMSSASLASATTVTFTFNNSLLETNDLLYLQQKGGTNGAYNIWPSGTTSGLTVICVRNISGGSLSEAVPIYFAIIKGVVS